MTERVFWSGVRSQSHVVQAAAWLRHRLAESPDDIVLVNLGVGGFLGRRPVTTADLDSLLPADPRLRRVDSADHAGRPGERLTYLAVGAPGIKPWLRLLTANPGRRIPVVVTDEGIGSYGSWRSRRDAWRREGGREPWPTIRALAVAGARRGLTTTRWAQYEPTVAGWRVNPDIAAELTRYAAARTPHLAVFLSQPWVELGLLDGQRYAAHVRAVGDAVTGAGWTFAVRPHPAEDATRYAEWTVLAGNRPAELDPRVNGASAALGATSTALLNLAAAFGVPALRVTTPDLAFLDAGLSRDQSALLDRWVPHRAGERGVREWIEGLA